MATREVITLVCDWCETENKVHTHTVALDDVEVEFEACTPCWKKFRRAIYPETGAMNTHATCRTCGETPNTIKSTTCQQGLAHDWLDSGEVK